MTDGIVRDDDVRCGMPQMHAPAGIASGHIVGDVAVWTGEIDALHQLARSLRAAYVVHPVAGNLVVHRRAAEAVIHVSAVDAGAGDAALAERNIMDTISQNARVG